MALPVTYDDVLAAAERVRPFVHRTPLWRCRSVDERAGCEVIFKCENLQRIGAFKFRGAVNTISQLTADERARGVITHSSGNHAQAAALAARLHDVKATVVMPENAPSVKRAAVEGYGADVVTCEATIEARVATTEKLIAKSGAVLVHPYEDTRVVAGQGTAALELLEEEPNLDAILAPIGGGGLLAGTTLAAGGASPDTRVIGCEPAGADDAYRSLTSGERVISHVPRTIADGLLTTIGQIAFDILREHAIPILLVSEEEIVDAMRFVWERTKLIIEPSSAVAVAPLLFRKTDLAGKRVGVIISGGNVDAGVYFGGLAT